MNRLALGLITLYQRFLSPYKGFRCAAGAYYRTGSCSNVVRQIVREHGLLGGLGRIRRQFTRCACAARRIEEEKKKKKRRKERNPAADAACGFAEIGCWGCAFWN